MDGKDLNNYVCGHLIVDQLENEEDKLIIRNEIRKKTRTKDKKKLLQIRKYKKLGMDAKWWVRKGQKLRGKEILMTVEDNITGYNFGRIFYHIEQRVKKRLIGKNRID